jgi:hypothetical protein
MNCVIVILDEKLEFLYFNECPTAFDDRSHNTYEAHFSDDDNGFYDFLRCSKGDIIGVRWFPHEDSILRGDRTSYLKELNRTNIATDCQELEIFFSETRTIDDRRSGDQEFLKNNLFFSSHGKCAISFAIDGLSDQEKRSLP